MKVKIMINKKHTFNFKGFTVQVGMIYGYDYNGLPFVSNGRMLNNSVYVYTIGGYDETNHPIWTRRKITDNCVLFDLIHRGVEKRKNADIIDVNYATSAQLEADRWKIKSKKNEGILHNGCHSNHYGYVMTRRECWC